MSDLVSESRVRVLVSACLLGEAVRYDGGILMPNTIIARWVDAGIVVGLCPEVAGGLPVPRPAAEISADGVIRQRDGSDVTLPFIRGAQEALRLCQHHGIRMAVLKEGSPSCGSSAVRDGSFSGVKINGEGVTTALLRSHGIEVFGEQQLDQAQAWLDKGGQ